MAATDRHHTCHAYACNSNVPPRMLMCRKHWSMVPKYLQDAVWRYYKPGQERRMNPSHDYLRTAANAVRFVAATEGHDEQAVENDPAVAGYMSWIQLTDECGNPACPCSMQAAI